METTTTTTTPAQAKKRAPNPKEMEIIEVMRKILQGRIHTCTEIELALAGHSREWRDALGELFNTFLHEGEERFWRAYEAISRCYPQYGQWRDLLAVPAELPAPVPQTPRPAAILLSEVEPQEVRWLWDQRLALGKVTMLDGDPGMGKSMLTLDLAARTTRGWVMPDTTPGLGEPAGVVLIAPEDNLADTIQPRLRRAGADLSRVASLGTIPVTDSSTGFPYRRPFQLAEDLETLAETIDLVQARLLIIDPVMSLFGNKDTYRDNDVRAALAPLQMVLETKMVAGMLVRHLTKGSSSNNALYRGSGSIAFVALARTAMMVVNDPYDPDKSVLLHTKSNIGQIGSQLCFSVQSEEPPEDPRPHVCWHGECNYSKEELDAAASDKAVATSHDEHKPTTARDEILRVLEEHAPDAMSLTDVAGALPEISFSTIRVTLSRMVKDGEIEQPARGKYGVTDL